MSIRDNEKMAAVIREEVKDDITLSSPPYNEILPVLSGFSSNSTKQALL